MNSEKAAWLLSAAVVGADVCCLWPWSRGKNGYGQASVGGVMTAAHVIACTTANGRRPPGKQAAHSCGQPACCSGRHLRWATHSENQADRVVHGTTNRGVRNGQAKITIIDVRAIRDRYAAGGITQQQLGDEYGVAKTTVSAIVTHKTWREI